MARYALYWAPAPGSPLHAFGSSWLGRDAVMKQSMTQPMIPGLPPGRFAELTAEARRYGWHATLKPPFAIKPGMTAAGLADAVTTLAARLQPFTAPPLEVRRLGRFLAMVPSAPAPGINALAASLVEGLDDFRAPESEEAVAKRRAKGLTPRQDEYLMRWGYPYVFEEYRFHMTLTGPVDDAEAAAIRAVLDPLARPLAERALTVDTVSIFGEPQRGQPFRMLARIPMA